MRLQHTKDRKELSAVLALMSVACLALIVACVSAQEKSSGAPQKSAASTPSQALPDTVAGRQLAEYLRVFNLGDREVYRRFVAENFSKSALAQRGVEERVMRWESFYNSARGLKLEGIEQSADHEIKAIAQTVLTEERLRLNLKVEAESPYGITDFTIEPAPRSASARSARSKMSEAEMAKELEAYLSKLVSADMFSGVVLIAKDGKPIFKKAYGVANKSINSPNNIETKFNLGSMNKMFTAVAIAQLAEQGKLSFDDRVGKHLPDYPNKEVADKVTIHQLLTHTSGMGTYFNEKYFAGRANVRTVADNLPFFVDEPLAFEPGTKWAYSNAGFTVLGLIIEKLSGQSYYDYVREHIFKPAGMTNTGFYDPNREIPNLAIGYTNMTPNGFAPGPRQDNSSRREMIGGPAGGGFSTAGDLLKFHIALRSHKLLSQKYTDLVTTGKVDSPGGGKYAYGFSDRVVDEKRIFGHNGGFPGIAANLDMYRDLGYTAIVLSNYDPPTMMPVVGKIREIIARL